MPKKMRYYFTLATNHASSLSFNFAITPKSSSVVVSPFTSPLLASSRNRRRMIFPLRVFGSMSVKRMSSGLAMAPISFATHFRNSSFNSGVGFLPCSEGYESRDGLALDVIRTRDDRGFGNRFVRDQRGLYFHRAQAVAGDVDHVVHPAHHPEIAVFIFAGTIAGEVCGRNLRPVLADTSGRDRHRSCAAFPARAA